MRSATWGTARWSLNRAARIMPAPELQGDSSAQLWSSRRTSADVTAVGSPATIRAATARNSAIAAGSSSRAARSPSRVGNATATGPPARVSSVSQNFGSKRRLVPYPSCEIDAQSPGAPRICSNFGGARRATCATAIWSKASIVNPDCFRSLAFTNHTAVGASIANCRTAPDMYGRATNRRVMSPPIVACIACNPITGRVVN